MTINVLIVDDSGFFRRRLTALINASEDLNVIGAAENGAEAVEMNERLKPDVITMDYEMPVMDGITAVRKIMEKQPVPILMFSSMTHEGAKVTLDSLAAGALDFLPKQFEEIAKGTDEVQSIVTNAIRNIASSNYRVKVPALTPVLKATVNESGVNELSVKEVTNASNRIKTVTTDVSEKSAVSTNINKPMPVSRNKMNASRLVIIGTSTGGPIALQQVLVNLPKAYSKPIIIVQHMPSNFTKAFAERLDGLCNIQVKEAENGDMIKPGLALLAPGGKQVLLSHNGSVKVVDGDDRMNYKPSVDVTFGSAANVYPDGVLGVVLTGMGTDGREGARLLKQSGSSVWAQDQESSVIYGMPMAVAKAGLVDEVHNLESLSTRLQEIG